MSIASAPVYHVKYGGPVTDAVVTTWASANSVNNATHWIRLFKGQWYAVSAALLSQRDAINTFHYSKNDQGTLA